jgi:hypothetical protein
LATDTSFVVWAGPLKSLKGQRPAPDLKVLGWLDVVDEDRVFISVRSIAELRRGIALMDDDRRTALAPWLPPICGHASPSGSCRSIKRLRSTRAG